MSSDEDGGPIGLGASRRKSREDLDSDDDLGGVGLGFSQSSKKRRGGRDENILGVFADAEEFGRKRAKGGGKTQGTKTLSFVKGTTLQPTAIPQPKAEKTEDEHKGSDDEIDSRFRLDGAPNAPNLQPVVEGPKLPAKNKLSFTQMSSNYGKGFAMMQKMGFTGGGLGKYNDGIANPIEVLKRQGRQGIQDDGEKADQDLYGNSAVESQRLEAILSEGKKKKEDGPKKSEGWKRDEKAKRPKVTYKTAAELAKEVPAMRIVDMRGPEVRVATSFAELSASLSGEAVQSLKELRHNTRLLVAKYEEKIRSSAERRIHFENVLLSVAKEQERLKAAEGIGEDEVKSCKELVSEVEALREQQDLGSISLNDLAKSFLRIRRTSPKEFRALHLADVAFSLAVPTAKRELATWRPLHKPDEGLSLLRPWRDFVEHLGSDDKSGRAVLTTAKAQLGALLEATLLPRLRHAVSEWSPREPDSCIDLMERCKSALPSDVAEVLIAEAVLPRLRAEVESWDPRVDKISAHLWLHPWLPVLGSKLDVLWPPVRFKISACLDRWDPSDESAYGLLKPWKSVFGPSNWDPIIEKVLLRLERALAEMPIRPDGQELGPMKDLLRWMDLAPLAGIARVLESSFFPPWHAALRTWLRTPGCEFAEVLQWYQGWRALLPNELREQPSVQRQLTNGLEVMKHMMASGGLLEDDLPAPPPVSQESAGEARRSSKAQQEDINLSLADYLTEVAAQEGLVFLPKKTQQNGKQVYQLGSISIYLDRNLVFAAPESGDGEWKAVSMDEVLALAKKRKEAAKRKV